MTDKEKLELIEEILSSCWETEPDRLGDKRGHYYAMLNAIGVVVDMGASQ